MWIRSQDDHSLTEDKKNIDVNTVYEKGKIKSLEEVFCPECYDLTKKENITLYEGREMCRNCYNEEIEFEENMRKGL